MRQLPLALLALVGSMLSCVDDEVTSPAPVPVLASLASGTFTLTIDQGGAITLREGDQILTYLPRGGLSLGRVGEVRDDLSYDPYHLVVPSELYRAPADLRFESPSTASILSQSDTSLEIQLDYPSGPSVLDVEVRQTGRFDLSLVPGQDDVVFFRMSTRVGETEGLYGLGESFDGVDQRGKVKGMQLELDPSTESSNNEAHVPIPLLLGTNRWGLFVDDPHAAVFDVATQSSDRVDATFGTGKDSKKGLSFYLFGAEKPLDLVRYYYDLTGYPKLPARWAFGPLVWRNENVDQAQVESDLETMRSLDLPATAIWLDRPYATDVSTFDYDPTRYDDSAHMIDRAHALGFRMALWHVPYLDEKSDATAALRAQAESLGVFPPVHGLPLNDWGVPLDFTNPAAVSFWQSHLRAYTDHGIDGFKLDYGEDVGPGLTEARNPWQFADGSDERTMSGRYQLFYHSTYADLLPEDGGFLLCRHATAGDQKNGPIIWPGDLDASFAKMGETSDDGSYVSVGGLPASLIGGLSLGVSGFPFYGADTGGYRHSPPDKELFIRWFEQTALSPVMQIGNGASTVAWEPDPETGFDTELLDLYRQYTRLHLRLFPYEYTYANRLLTDGRPIARPLGFAYPGIGVHPDDEYVFGDDLLVAPVLGRGVTSREVIFPEGEWIDWWTGEHIGGGTTKAVDAPLGTLPLYLRAGAIVPMARPTLDTVSPTTEHDTVDSLDGASGLLYVRVTQGAEGAFTLYDGTQFSSQPTDEHSFVVNVDSGDEFDNGGLVELVGWGEDPPSDVFVDGVSVSLLSNAGLLEALDAGFAFTSDTGGTVWVRFAPGPHIVEIFPQGS